MKLFGSACRELDQLDTSTPTEVAQRVYRLVESSALWPRPWGGAGGARQRHPGVFTVPTFIPLVAWIKMGAPAAIRQSYFNRFRFGDVLKMAASDWSSEVRYASGLIATLSRDFATGSNRDWVRFLDH